MDSDNSSLENLTFQSLTYGTLDMMEVISHIKDFLEEKPQASYRLVIGTDSHERNNMGDSKNGKIINLVTAILVHREGFGGRYFWRRKEQGNIHSLRQKIYAETMMSLDFASFFVPLLKQSLDGKQLNYDLEIHIDVGEHGDTREMIKEVVGMVTGSGYVAKTKPESFGASYVADKHT